MKKIVLITCITSITLTGILCNIKTVLGKENNVPTSPTKLENIEKISSSESHNISICIEGNGYCFDYTITANGLKFKD